MEGLAGLIEAELSRLARAHRSPEAFEALFRVLWEGRRAGVACDGELRRTRGMSESESDVQPEWFPAGTTSGQLGGRIFRAMKFAPLSQFDGAHHKTWVVDQMVRALLGCPMQEREFTGDRGRTYTAAVQGENDAYRRFVAENPDWDEGIAP
jgi:hypothetical protein